MSDTSSLPGMLFELHNEKKSKGFFLYELIHRLGSGCSTVVEDTPRDREIVGLNPAGCGAFSLLYLISSASLIRSLVEVQHY